MLHLDKVTPGGLTNYVLRARRFLLDSKNNVNPFDNYQPEIPHGFSLVPGEPLFEEMEELGLQELQKVCFVLIAGGLGERLGYSGIKVDLPVTTIEPNYCYLSFYAQYVKACRQRAVALDAALDREDFYVPLCIMVSDDTHDRTVALLESNHYFGLDKNHIDIVKQENVPALLDNDGKIALQEGGALKIVTKPHGHGDVHTLLYQNQVAQKWLAQGKEWMVFIQDTNALALKTIPSVLGVSKKNNWEMNSITVPRRPGESVGAICRLVDVTDPTKEIVINVEYNQLDPLLKSKWEKGGDVANEQGFSYFPGNTNTLVFKLQEYVENLERTKGVIPEFVNPKYADEQRTTFKAPTRLECMMQDYPKQLSNKGSVGFTSYDTWYCFSPVKNNIKDGAVLAAKHMPTFSAAQGEHEFFQWTNKMLEKVGVQVEYNTEAEDYEGIKLAFGPKVLLDPTFALTLSELRLKFQGVNRISKDSTLFLSGQDATVENLSLNGVLRVNSGDKVTGEVVNAERVVFEHSA